MIKEIRYETPVDDIAKIKGKVIFLAGPTVRGNQQHLTSWRFEAIEELKKQGFDGTVIIPEFTSKSESDKGKEWIPLWEFEGLKRAAIILFWLPRTRELIGLTTNWEHGYWVGKHQDKMIYGRPDDAYRIGYLDIMWKAAAKYVGHIESPIFTTLEDTIKATIAAVDRVTCKLCGEVSNPSIHGGCDEWQNEKCNWHLVFPESTIIN